MRPEENCAKIFKPGDKVTILSWDELVLKSVSDKITLVFPSNYIFRKNHEHLCTKTFTVMYNFGGHYTLYEYEARGIKITDEMLVIPELNLLAQEITNTILNKDLYDYSLAC